MLAFFSQGVPLDVPRERMKVILFNQYADFTTYSLRFDKSLIHAAGYWSPINNISVFFDNSSRPEASALQKEGEKIAELGRELEGPARKDLVRLGNALSVLSKIEQEAQDVEVVSHEATHQLAGNTGLFPRSVRIPRWCHEGLAAYFESPDDIAWSGIGAVNQRRLDNYRELARADREHSNIDFIVSDAVFDLAVSIQGQEYGYGQAWAMTHFLLNTRFADFIKFYRRLGEMPPDVELSERILLTLFDECIGEDREILDMEWRRYMDGLKPDVQRIIDGDDE
jgi:hypothetical protein